MTAEMEKFHRFVRNVGDPQVPRGTDPLEHGDGDIMVLWRFTSSKILTNQNEA